MLHFDQVALFSFCTLFSCCILSYCVFPVVKFFHTALILCCPFFSGYTFFMLHLFVLHFSRGALSSRCTFIVFYFFSFCFMLHSVHVAVFCCCTPFRLRFFCFALFSFYTLFLFHLFLSFTFLMLHLLSFYTLFALHFFQVTPFSCCTFFLLHSIRVVLFSCCTFFCIAFFSYLTFFVMQCSNLFVFYVFRAFYVASFSC